MGIIQEVDVGSSRPCIFSISTSLRTFVAIADTGSFTRAADVVHKTQSAVSMQMKRLEERLGRSIFERDGRLSKLTDEGERLLDYARRIVRLNTECMASFNDNELVGRVRLGLPDDYADRYLPEILARFSRSNPEGGGDGDVRADAKSDRAGAARRCRSRDHHSCRSARPFGDRADRATALGDVGPSRGARGAHHSRWRSGGPIATGGIPRQKHWRAPTDPSGFSMSRGIRRPSAPPSWRDLLFRFCRKAQCVLGCAF